MTIWSAPTKMSKLPHLVIARLVLMVRSTALGAEPLQLPDTEDSSASPPRPWPNSCAMVPHELPNVTCATATAAATEAGSVQHDQDELVVRRAPSSAPSPAGSPSVPYSNQRAPTIQANRRP